MADKKNYTYEELQKAVADADRDARLEMKVDYLIEKLEDPENGCIACRREIKTLRGRLDLLEKKVDRVLCIGGALVALFMVFGRDVIAWLLHLWRGG